MAVVPARAWSAAGVTSLKALQAPFLFDSDEHVAAVVNDAAITTDLFSGFDGSGVTGLTLFPELLRHLFSFDESMLTPADVKGRTIRAISSLETTAIIEALGGTAVDPDDDAYQKGVDAGTIHGTDSGFTLSAGERDQSPRDGDRQRRPLRQGHDPGHRTAPCGQASTTASGRSSRRVRCDPGMGDRPPGARTPTPQPCSAPAAAPSSWPMPPGSLHSAPRRHPSTPPSKPTLRPSGRSQPSGRGPPGRHRPRSRLRASHDADHAGGPMAATYPTASTECEATEAYLQGRPYPDYVRAARWGFTPLHSVTVSGSFDYKAPQRWRMTIRKGIYRVDGDDVYWLWDPCCSHPNPVLHLKWSVDGSRTLTLVTLVSGASGLGAGPAVPEGRRREFRDLSLVIHRRSPPASPDREVGGDLSFPRRVGLRSRGFPPRAAARSTSPCSPDPPLEHRPAPSVVNDLEPQSLVMCPEIHADRRCRRVLEGVRDGLCADEIDRRRQTIRQVARVSTSTRTSTLASPPSWHEGGRPDPRSSASAGPSPLDSDRSPDSSAGEAAATPRDRRAIAGSTSTGILDQGAKLDRATHRLLDPARPQRRSVHCRRRRAAEASRPGGPQPLNAGSPEAGHSLPQRRAAASIDGIKPGS